MQTSQCCSNDLQSLESVVCMIVRALVSVFLVNRILRAQVKHFSWSSCFAAFAKIMRS